MSKWPKWAFRVLEFAAFDLVSAALFFVYQDIIYTALTTLLLAVLFHFYILKRWMSMRHTVKIKKEMAFWMNSVVVQTTVTPSLVTTIDEIKPLLPAHLHDMISMDESASVIATIEPLVYYFNHPHYMMFHRLLELYVEQGGQLVTMSRQILLSVAQEQQDFYRYLAANHKRLRELSTGWIFTFTALVYLKFLLPSFYTIQVTEGYFKFAILLNFILVGYSFYLFFKQYRPLNLEKGWELE